MYTVCIKQQSKKHKHFFYLSEAEKFAQSNYCSESERKINSVDLT